MWVRETDDQVLLMIAYQASTTNLIFYLNFGAYYSKISGSKKLPKLSDWHLFARYERFHQLAVPEYNKLFSLGDDSGNPLAERCSEIASFSKANIIPNLLTFGDYRLLDSKLRSEGTKIFDPYWARNLKKDDVAEHIAKYVVGPS